MEEFGDKIVREVRESIPESEPLDKYVWVEDHREETETEIIVYCRAVERKDWRPPEPPIPPEPEPPAPEPTKPTIEDYNRAMETSLLATRMARGYDTREPSDYIFSEDPRWKQDALDWIKYRDAVMHYGQDVMNHYAETGEAPSIEEFVKNLPTIEWTFKGEEQ